MLGRRVEVGEAGPLEEAVEGLSNGDRRPDADTAHAQGCDPEADKRDAEKKKQEEKRVAEVREAGLNITLRQPLGVVGIISPWNYPLQLALSRSTVRGAGAT